MKQSIGCLLDHRTLRLLPEALSRMEAGFGELPLFAGPTADIRGLERVLAEVADRLQDNYPYFHPLYAGQMLKPPHPVARLAYALALWINPNNHALDGGRASSAMEKEAVAELARMIGWRKHLGHLCSGGTMANLEALWIAGQLRPGSTIVASQQAHYTHERISRVLQLNFDSVPCDAQGRMDTVALERRLKKGGVGTIVAAMGTTAVGAVDPLPRLLELRRHFGFRLHADAAYGGYFTLADNLAKDTSHAFQQLREVDSLVIDPHKHGLQPYGCGCILFRDPKVGRFYQHESPYTYFTSTELHLGEISLECSRPGAAAVSLWATQRLMPLVKKGTFARILHDTRAAALELYSRLCADARFVVPFPPELDIVVWTLRAARVSEASALARRVFTAAAKRHLHLALVELPFRFFGSTSGPMQRDRETITCLRSVLMKAEHRQWVDRIWEIVTRATQASFSNPRRLGIVAPLR
jgi:tyrosine decarboxylase/aspartate 1-decarboxylase